MIATHTDNTHVVSYFQEEAAFIHACAQWKALFPGFRVRGCCADDVLPAGLVLARCKKMKIGKQVGTRDSLLFKTIIQKPPVGLRMLKNDNRRGGKNIRKQKEKITHAGYSRD